MTGTPAPRPPRPGLTRWLKSPQTLTALGLVTGWTAMYLAYRNNLVGIVLALVTTLVTMTALRRGDAITRERSMRLRRALDAAGTRNRELERLRHLSATLLSGRAVVELQQEVAGAVADLLEAESGGVAMLVEEGRFVKLVAATGPLGATIGQLLPIEESLLGWVVLHDQPMLSQDINADPRNFDVRAFTGPLATAAMVPLRSAGIVIGAVAAYNRSDGRPFSDHDLQLLQILGDQVVVGLDRATVLEESRQNERALAAKNRELERVTQLKSEFLANMSHELRTPLNAIIGFSDLILTGDIGPVSDVQRDFLESVLRNGRHLLGLINSVLDLSKIEAGRMALSLAPTDLREAITAAVADTASLRAAKGQECVVQMEEGEPLDVTADAVRVRQVLFNLLSNASKFTPDGGVITLTGLCARTPLPVPAERSGEASRLVSRDAVWISVADSGIGIRPEDMPKLFKEFSQVDSAFNRQQQGTGLGLALCKNFVEQHGGTIGADSVPGTGSTFWFILPVDGPVRRT